MGVGMGAMATTGKVDELAGSNRALILRLLGFAWQYRARSLQVLGLQVVMLALGLSGLGLTGLGIDYLRYAVSGGVSVPTVFGRPLAVNVDPFVVICWIAGGIFGFALLRAVLNYSYSMSVAHLVQAKIVVDLREQIFKKLQQLSFRFFDRHTSGSIINRVTGDVQAVRLFIDGVFLQSIIMLLSLVVYLFYMVQIHLWLTLVCLATTPAMWMISARFSQLLRPAYEESRRLMDDLVLQLSETIQGIQTVKAFARERMLQERFHEMNVRVREQRRSIFRKVSVFSPLITFLTQVNLFVLLLYGGYLTIHGEIALGGGLVVFAGLLQQFSGQVANLSGLIDSVQQSLAGARRVFAIIDTPVEIERPAIVKQLGKVRGEVRFADVGFSYRADMPALQGIDITVRAGERIAVVGATGAGKSALMSLIPRFYDPDRGQILIDGVDIREVDPAELRRNIGIVFQENFLFSNTVAANIAFGAPDASRERIERAARIAHAHDFIMELDGGYDAVLEEGGSNLSGGQRQRLAIARALLHDPPILLLDDPTAAIDPDTEHEILAAMESAVEGRTTFMVAHRLSGLRRADRILVLERGRLVQVGRHDELVAVAGPYREAAALQMIDLADWQARRGTANDQGGDQ
jgi:ATP-binding cassette subfamily B protein